METNQITVKTLVSANKQKVWNYYTLPEHITKWNFASDDWCCPSASNDLKIGGTYNARMEAKDGSFGFDFIATYTAISDGEYLTYVFGERQAHIAFHDKGEQQTEVIISFDPETENAIELQEQGWQAILNQFKNYTENH